MKTNGDIFITHNNHTPAIKEKRTAIDQVIIDIVVFSKNRLDQELKTNASLLEIHPLLLTNTIVSNFVINLLDNYILMFSTPQERLKCVDDLGDCIHQSINEAWRMVETLQNKEGEKH